MNRLDTLIEEVRDYGEDCRREGAHSERLRIAGRFLKLDKESGGNGGAPMIAMICDLCDLSKEEVQHLIDLRGRANS